jgi:hypothetical protein
MDAQKKEFVKPLNRCIVAAASFASDLFDSTIQRFNDSTRFTAD